jgi:large subunit ribosomal protein L25
MTDTYPVQRREVLGKKVRQLRRDGTLPANLYGRNQESIAVQLPYMQARDMLNAHGRNTLIEVHIEGEPEPRPVVVREVAQNPVTRALLHVDFYQVDLTRMLSGQVPVSLVGEAPAVDRLGGILVQYADVVEVEALPQNMPERIEASVARLAAFDDQLMLQHLMAPPGVRFLSDPETLIASVMRPRLVAADEEEVPEGEEGAEEAEGEEADGAEATGDGEESSEEE